MTKSLRTLLTFSLLLSLLSSSAWARRPAAKTQYRWERLRIVQVLPSQVFARLGLTHSTRYGFTRDGFTKGTPDPTFPPGLTDVVPYDETHLLLVRGTPQGLAEFRARVLATENEIEITGRWRVTIDLLPSGADTPLASSVPQDVQSDLPFQVTVGSADSPQEFQLRVHVNGDAITVVSCQAGLFPPSTEAALGVVTPAQVWTAPVTRPVLPVDTVLFNDSSAARQSARRRLGLPEEADARDYQVRVTVTSLAPPGAEHSGLRPLLPQSTPAPASVAMPAPLEDNAASRP